MHSHLTQNRPIASLKQEIEVLLDSAIKTNNYSEIEVTQLLGICHEVIHEVYPSIAHAIGFNGNESVTNDLKEYIAKTLTLEYINADASM